MTTPFGYEPFSERMFPPGGVGACRQELQVNGGSAVNLVGFRGRPASSTRVRGTIEAIRRELGAGGGLLYRYPPGRDGLPGLEGAFLPYSFWQARSEQPAAKRLVPTLEAPPHGERLSCRCERARWRNERGGREGCPDRASIRGPQHHALGARPGEDVRSRRWGQ